MCCDRKQHSNANVSFFLSCPFFSFLSSISCGTVCAETATDNRYPWLLLVERYWFCFVFTLVHLVSKRCSIQKLMTNNTNDQHLEFAFIFFFFHWRNFPWRTWDTAARQISLIRWCSDAIDSSINEFRSRRTGFIRDRLMIFRQFSIRIRVLWLLYEIKITVKKNIHSILTEGIKAKKKSCFSKNSTS